MPELPTSNSLQLTLAVEGMTCSACVGRVENALLSVPGVTQANVNLTTGIASVLTHPQPSDSLIQAVTHAGYNATLMDPSQSPSELLSSLAQRNTSHLHKSQNRLIIGLTFGIPAIVLDILASHTSLPLPLTILAILLSTLVLIFTGRIFFLNAWRAGLHPTMDTLIALGSGTAFLSALITYSLSFFTPVTHHHETTSHSELHAAVTIILLVTLGKYLEARAKAAANAAITNLAQQSSPTATILNEDETLATIPASQVALGDRLQILAHQTVPVDGQLLSGSGSLDTSLITGESRPVEISTTAQSPTAPLLIPGGSSLLDGRLIIRATSTAGNSTIARILHLVQNAQASKTKIQGLADRLAAIFTPIVLGLAVLTFAGWIYYGFIISSQPNPWLLALSAAIATIVIACPCAMGLATPTAITVATSRAAKLGILLSNAHTLERASSGITTICFDKTGTLTTGLFHLQAIHLAPGSTLHTPNELLQLAASFEQYATHPLAQAITTAAQNQHLSLHDPDSFSSIPGGGLQGELNQREVHLGSVLWLESLGINSAPLAPQIAEQQTLGTTLVLVAINRQVVGLLALSDTLRPDAASTISTLRSRGLKVGVISGDTPQAVHGILQNITVDFIAAQVRPEQKAQKVQELRSSSPGIVFVGDGINDAPALAAADLGIALRHTSGNSNDLAQSAGDIILLSDRLATIPQTLELCRGTLKIIKQNLFWAFFYNFLALPLAMIGQLPPALAAAAMMFSSLFVVGNALRIYRLASTPPKIP